ncbi:MAG: LysM peptidoglycan-binding domain-containing protein [Ardenticatenaceae bacterium]|nr:LysM peptidoglycan-binding domain-containing protein [Ardenticatenaceae bacterium]
MLAKRWIKVVVAVGVALVLVTAVYASTYQVKKGDTLYGLAKQFKTTVNDIAAANNIANPNLIYEGQILEIPDGTSNPVPTPAPQPPTTPPPTSGTYTVKPGDSLFRIALQFGTTVSAIVQANNILNPSLIYVGQVLIIPGGTGSTPPPTNPSPNSGLALGGQSHGFDHVDLMKQAGMSWIKIQYKWSPGDDANSLAARIQAAHDNNLKILLSITGANTYPAAGSLDFGGFVSFVGNVAALGPDAIEVWNEMNIDFEWPAGEISPATYVNSMLRPAYNAIKAANANVMVISGALAPTGFDNGHNAWADDRYLAGMNAAGAASYMDCVGVHHNAGATAPNMFTGHPGGTHYSWYFRPTLDLYYGSFGGARPVCFTELGYLSPEGFPGLSSNFGWAADTSVQEHAQWLGDAVRFAKSTGHVRLLIVFNVDFTEYDVNGDPQAGYAILRPDGSCPACATLSAAMNGS